LAGRWGRRWVEGVLGGGRGLWSEWVWFVTVMKSGSVGGEFLRFLGGGGGGVSSFHQ